MLDRKKIKIKNPIGFKLSLLRNIVSGGKLSIPV